MSKNIKHYYAPIIGTVVLFMLIIIILIVLDANSILLTDSISYLSLAISVISLVFMIIIFGIETKKSDCQTMNLKSINEHLSFEPIIFPKSIEKVIHLIQQYKNRKQKQYYLHIYTDVPGYAIFSNNKLWNEFYEALSDAKKNFCINWHFYSEEKLNEHIDKQFEPWYSFSQQQINSKIKEPISNIHNRHLSCTYKSTCKSTKPTDCKIIRTIKAECSSTELVKKNIDSIKDRVKELHKFAIAKINELTEDGDVQITKISNDLPFFAWIFLEKNRNKLEPIAGIVSYSFYNANGEEREKGFMTKDKKLLEILYEIINNQKKNEKFRS